MKDLVEISIWTYGTGPLKFVLFLLCVLWLAIWSGIKEDRT
jgi:hypothetical protein